MATIFFKENPNLNNYKIAFNLEYLDWKLIRINKAMPSLKNPTNSGMSHGHSTSQRLVNFEARNSFIFGWNSGRM